MIWSATCVCAQALTLRAAKLLYSHVCMLCVAWTLTFSVLAALEPCCLWYSQTH